MPLFEVSVTNAQLNLLLSELKRAGLHVPGQFAAPHDRLKRRHRVSLSSVLEWRRLFFQQQRGCPKKLISC